MKRFPKTIGLWGLVFIIGFILLTSTPVSAADTIKIGMIYSMTGAGSVMGAMQKPSTMLAIDEINKAGGVKLGDKRYKIEVIHRDDETKPDVAIRRVNEMVMDHGVKVIIGGTFSHVSVAINEASKRHKFWFMASN
ncbi:MAG: ABC transporter substrate-binding protein, partial [Deltaproteobacteria bacterium]